MSKIIVRPLNIGIKATGLVSPKKSVPILACNWAISIIFLSADPIDIPSTLLSSVNGTAALSSPVKKPKISKAIKLILKLLLISAFII